MIQEISFSCALTKISLIIFLGLIPTIFAQSTENDIFTVVGEEKLYFSKNIRQDKILFATCNEDDLHKNRPRVNCMIHTKQIPIIADKSKTRSCSLDYTFKKFHQFEGKTVYHDALELEIIPKTNKVLISWREMKNFPTNTLSIYRSIGILDMKRCKLSRILPLKLFSQGESNSILISNIVVYDKSFDVIISDPKICIGMSECRVTYDEFGNQIGRVKPFKTQQIGIFTVPVVNNSDSEGFFISTGTIRGTKNVAVEHVKKSGESKKFVSFDSDEFTKSQPIISMSHKMFTICSRIKNHTIKCFQFTPNSVRENLKFESNGFENVVAVHNPIQGKSILLATLDCDKEINTICQSYNLRYVNANNVEKANPLQRAIDLNCTGNVEDFVSFFREKQDLICLNILCVRESLIGERRSESTLVFVESCTSTKFLSRALFTN